jgi:hypothetical protein
MKATAATASLAELLKASPEWRCFYRACCETGARRLRSQTWQFRDELRERGEWFGLSEVEDALLIIARRTLPETPAAQWDTEWAAGVCKDAIARLAEHCAGLCAEDRDALDLSGQDVWDERMRDAGEANDPAAFRAALNEWERAGLEALKAARQRSAAV